MTKTLKTFALAAALAFASVGAHALSVVQDPSFDTVIGQGPWYVGSGAPIANGTVTLAAGDSFYQSFSVTATGDYVIGFDVLGAGEGSSRVFNSTAVGAGDFSTPVAWAGATPTATTVWVAPTRVEYTLSADAGQSYHLYVSGFGTGVQLDNLSVTAVPEPESYAMFAAGIGALGLLARRRKTA